MPLNNQQFDSILRTYEEKQLHNRHLLEQRQAQVYSAVPEYEELEHLIAGVSVSQGKKLLDGDEHALEDLKKQLSILSAKKNQALLSAGFPPDYLSGVYECPDCKDTGYIGLEKCHCFREKIIEILYSQSNIHENLKTENFQNLSYEYYDGEPLRLFQSAVMNCKEFVKSFNSDYHNLFFYGTVGTGKSFLSCCVAKELIESGQSVIYFSSSGLFDLLSQQTFHNNNKSSLTGLYEDLYGCDLLIIDDIGTELTNAFVTSQLFACLNERHLRKKATIISTNLSLEGIRDRYSDRIFSRITSNYNLLKLIGPDIRMTKKRLLNRK